jgi:Ca2+-binding EF-hand superfamily protein
MRHAACFLCAALACLSLGTRTRAGDEQDRLEEQMTTQWAHQKANRSFGHNHGERGNTIRDLEAAFPGKLKMGDPGTIENEGEKWFELLTGGTGDVWSKTDAVAAGLGPMYQRWIQRLELGPVPSIKKEEFLKFAKLIIGNAVQMMKGNGGEVNLEKEADKMFRILDLNSDGELTGNELTAGIKADRLADTNGDGRISKEEYREYFKRKVEAKADTLVTTFKANEKLFRNLDWENLSKPGAGGLPAWFTKFDLDMDGQISLFEWRQGGRPIAEFKEMDLNGDGLLTKDEYLRWQKKKQEEAAEKRREEGK